RGTAHVFFDATFQSREWVKDSAVDDQGRTVLAGTIEPGATSDPTQQRIAVARLLPDGSWDPGFGVGGLFFFDCTGGCGTDAIAVLDSGEIMLIGHANSAPSGDIVHFMRKLRADGVAFEIDFGFMGATGLDEWGGATVDSGGTFKMIRVSPSMVAAMVPL